MLLSVIYFYIVKCYHSNARSVRASLRCCGLEADGNNTASLLFADLLDLLARFLGCFSRKSSDGCRLVALLGSGSSAWNGSLPCKLLLHMSKACGLASLAGSGGNDRRCLPPRGGSSSIKWNGLSLSIARSKRSTRRPFLSGCTRWIRWPHQSWHKRKPVAEWCQKNSTNIWMTVDDEVTRGR